MKAPRPGGIGWIKPDKSMNEEQFRKELRKIIKRDFAGNQSDAARAWGCSRSNLNGVLAGRLPPFNSILKGAGYAWGIIRA